MYVSMMRDFFRTNGRSDEQANSGSWIEVYKISYNNINRLDQRSQWPCLLGWRVPSFLPGCNNDNHHDHPYRPNHPDHDYHGGVLQHYPDDTVWGPMHWGHATSADLLHWKHKPIALYPGIIIHQQRYHHHTAILGLLVFEATSQNSFEYFLLV